MICVEVTLNGVAKCVAGALSSETIAANVILYPNLGEAWLKVEGKIHPEHEPPADAHWASQKLALGDVMQIRLVQTDEPTAVKLSRSDPSITANDDIPFVCAFCGKEPEQIERMWAGSRAMICDECVTFMSEEFKHDSGGAPNNPLDRSRPR